jgi:hypothetical protein
MPLTPYQQSLWGRKKINDRDTWEWYTNFVGQRMQHNYWEYNVIGETMMENPQIKGILEIGTGCGGVTMLLGLWGIRYSIPVVTYETVRALYLPVEHVLDKLDVQIINQDCFDPHEKAFIEDFIKHNDPIYLVCDGGNKEKEIKTYAPLLGKEGLVSGHDWECEILSKNIEPFLLKKGFEPWKQHQWTEKNMQFATWKRRKV